MLISKPRIGSSDSDHIFSISTFMSKQSLGLAICEPMTDAMDSEPIADAMDSEPIQTCYETTLDFFMPGNYNISDSSNAILYFQIIKKPIKNPLIGCIVGIIVLSIGIPFPFSIPLILAFSAFLFTLIIYRFNVYNDL